MVYCVYYCVATCSSPTIFFDVDAMLLKSDTLQNVYSSGARIHFGQFLIEDESQRILRCIFSSGCIPWSHTIFFVFIGFRSSEEIQLCFYTIISSYFQRDNCERGCAFRRAIKCYPPTARPFRWFLPIVGTLNRVTMQYNST